jgi:8-oxo-dGTP diphosphatase
MDTHGGYEWKAQAYRRAVTTARAELPRIAVAVDVAIFSMRDERPVVALVERGNQPFQGMLALPGGFVEEAEGLAQAASRELAEETGIVVPARSLTQLGAFGAPHRDPRMRVVSIVFWAFVEGVADPVGGSDAAASHLVTVDDALGDQLDLAFDHRQILHEAWEATRR